MRYKLLQPLSFQTTWLVYGPGLAARPPLGTLHAARCIGTGLDMPRRKTTTSGQLKQQSLINFLKPETSSPLSDRSRTRTRPARLATRVPAQGTEPSDQSDTDSGVEAVHFESRDTVISDDDDDDLQPSSPVRKRRTAGEVESLADHRTLMSSDSDESSGANRGAALSITTNRPLARSPSTEPEPESVPKRRRLTRGTRPSSPEGSDNLLNEVNEAGKYFTGSYKTTTNSVHRYHPVSLS